MPQAPDIRGNRLVRPISNAHGRARAIGGTTDPLGGNSECLPQPEVGSIDRPKRSNSPALSPSDLAADNHFEPAIEIQVHLPVESVLLGAGAEHDVSSAT
jgi:hypothetical protein